MSDISLWLTQPTIISHRWKLFNIVIDVSMQIIFAERSTTKNAYRKKEYGKRCKMMTSFCETFSNNLFFYGAARLQMWWNDTEKNAMWYFFCKFSDVTILLHFFRNEILFPLEALRLASFSKKKKLYNL